MLVWLAEHLVKYYSGFNVFSYLTFRAIVSLLTALFISLWMGPRMIARLQKLSFGQVVRNDGPESHFSKRGTPTMGGIMILTAITVYPGAGPESVDQQLSLPITQVVSGLSGVKSTMSTSSPRPRASPMAPTPMRRLLANLTSWPSARPAASTCSCWVWAITATSASTSLAMSSPCAPTRSS